MIKELVFIGPSIAPLLRRPRPPSASLDLSNVRVFDCDFSRVDLHNVNLESFTADRVRLDHADLNDVPEPKNGTWGSFWWRAGKIGPDLRKYLCSLPRLKDNPSYYYQQGPTREESDRQEQLCSGN